MLREQASGQKYTDRKQRNDFYETVIWSYSVTSVTILSVQGGGAELSPLPIVKSVVLQLYNRDVLLYLFI